MPPRKGTPLDGVEIQLDRWLPEANACCAQPWRAISINYHSKRSIWDDRNLMTFSEHARAMYDHLAALYRYLRAQPDLHSRIRRYNSSSGLLVRIYRGKGTKRDHALFLATEKRLQQLVQLSTKELQRRTQGNTNGLP